jgi:hypothetical protein
MRATWANYLSRKYGIPVDDLDAVYRILTAIAGRDAEAGA